MKKIIAFIARLIQAGTQVYARKWSFLGVFAMTFFVFVMVLARYDLLPSLSRVAEVSADALTASAAVSTDHKELVEEPVKIGIEKINLSVTISNPVTTDIATLDRELLKGAVRYPTSAKLGETGNVVLFGHSSYLPVVGNQAYKAFNGIQKLVAGDTITVYAAEKAYTYRVRTMEKESAESNAGIQLNVSGRVLTLATCNSFGSKADRFIVTADFVESHSVSI